MDNSIVEFEKKKAEMLNYAKAMVNMPLESIVKTTKSKLLQKYYFEQLLPSAYSILIISQI